LSPSSDNNADAFFAKSTQVPLFSCSVDYHDVKVRQREQRMQGVYVKFCTVC